MCHNYIITGLMIWLRLNMGEKVPLGLSRVEGRGRNWVPWRWRRSWPGSDQAGRRARLVSVGVCVPGEGGRIPGSGRLSGRHRHQPALRLPGRLQHEPSPEDSGCGREESRSSALPSDWQDSFQGRSFRLSIEFAQWNFKFCLFPPDPSTFPTR